MFQSNCSLTEKDFKKLTNLFELKYLKLSSNKTKVDISKEYIIEWCCMWNKPTDIGKKCKIIAINNKLCLITFRKSNKPITKILLSRLYRFEDLTIID